MLRCNYKKMKLLRYFLLLLLITIPAGVSFAKRDQYKIPVLTYHHLLKDEENKHFINSATITPETFEEQIKFLHNEGYETITTDELYDYLSNKTALEGKKVLITFDDGYLSNLTYAYYILKKYNYTAVIFAITGLAPEAPVLFDTDTLPRISLEEIERPNDVFEFGSHTHDMHRRTDNNIAFLTSFPKEEVANDISISYNTLGLKKIFAYPYGEYNRETLDILKKLETMLAFTTKQGYVTRSNNKYMLPRFSIKRDTNFEQFRKIFDDITY